MRRTVVGFLVLLLVVPGLLFTAAGTVAWPMAWAYAVLVIAGSSGAHAALAVRHPDTLRERARGFGVPGAQRWDRWLAPLVVWGPVVAVVLAGLDHRWGWSTITSPTGQVVALGAALAGYLLAGWAMAENRFFVAVARIQPERGHTVVDTGPYRLIRHPGYAGALLGTLAIPFVLDSAWATVPAGLAAAALVVRTALEDRMLQRGLRGYPPYATRTRHRLLPGVW